MRGGRRNFKDRDQINKITAGSPECFSAMRCILDRRLLIAPPERYPSPPKRFWWGRRKPALPALEVEAVKNLRLALAGSRVSRRSDGSAECSDSGARPAELSHMGDTRYLSLRYQQRMPSPRILHHRRVQVDSGLYFHCGRRRRGSAVDGAEPCSALRRRARVRPGFQIPRRAGGAGELPP